MNEEEISDLKECDSVGRFCVHRFMYMWPFFVCFLWLNERLCLFTYLGMHPDGICFYYTCNGELLQYCVSTVAACKSESWLYLHLEEGLCDIVKF